MARVNARSRPRPARAGWAHRPLAELGKLLKERSVQLTPSAGPDTGDRSNDVPPDLETEDALFRAAMADVTPLPDRFRPPAAGGLRSRQTRTAGPDGDAEAMGRLRELVRHGRGFVVADTPEYIEGTGYCDNPEMARRLHRGDFAIQDHIDLHGLGADAAGEALDRFLKASVAAGRRAVLIVHGRGLSSPRRPVLKSRVQYWLTRGPWRKWVIAFSSARSCDGGAGATYVLLRRTPFTRRDRKRSSR